MTEDTEYYEDYGRDALAGSHSEWVRWSDPDYGTKLAVVVAGEVGEPLGESNTQAAERILGQWLGDDDADAQQFTVGRSGRTWLRGVAVRVFDEQGEVTEAWRAAVDEIIVPLEGYPLLDEDLYSELEWQVSFENLELDYGKAAELVAEALSEYGRDGIREYDHDEVVECVELLVKDGREVSDDEVEGLRYYVRQRLEDLDIPTLAALVAEEVDA
jgi:hypothetical protein